MINNSDKELKDQDIVKFLLYQQFYYGNDIIYGRTREISESINGSGKVIEKFLEILISNLHLIRKKKYIEYLELFSLNFFNINVNKIYQSFLEELNNIGTNIDFNLIISIFIGKLLQHLREQCFNEILSEIRIILIEKLARLKTRSSELKSKLEEVVEAKLEKLHNLFALNSPEISLIYNLAFLKFLAFKLEEFKVYKTTIKLLNKYIEIVSNKLIDEIY